MNSGWMHTANEKMATNQPIPWLIRVYQYLSYHHGRSFSIWWLIVWVAKINKKWRQFQVNGPDQRPFYLDFSDVGCIGYLTRGEISSFENLEREMVRRILSQDSVVLDIGANIGLWTRSLIPYVPLGRIYSFEPSAKTFILLRANTCDFNNIEIVNLALSDVTGTMGLSGGSSVLRHLTNQPKTGQEFVKVTTLDHWVEEVGLKRLDFIKIDVEGAEAKVLLGAEHALRKFHPTILFEQAPQNSIRFDNAGLESCVHILTSLGYSVRRILPDGSLSHNLEYSVKTTNNMWATALVQ